MTTLNPARSKSRTVASCKLPLGSPNFNLGATGATRNDTRWPLVIFELAPERFFVALARRGFALAGAMNPRALS